MLTTQCALQRFDPPGLVAMHGRAQNMTPHAANADDGLALLGRKVLVVEDEALLAMELQFTLEDEGAEVIGPALSLEAALTAIRESAKIDCAVLDVDLAGRDVFPAAQLLVDRRVPIVFHTGHGSPAVLLEMFPGSVTLTKPTLSSMVVAELTALLRR